MHVPRRNLLMVASVDKLGIMQPYFLPYIGYWQLLNYVDTFVVYDNIEYTKKGWFNRNRYLRDGQPVTFTVPLRKGHDTAHICDREVSPDFDRRKLIAQLTEAYRKAPFFDETMPLVHEVVTCEETNAFRFLYESIRTVCRHLAIETELVVSSTVPIDHQGLSAQSKVLAICEYFHATTYVNAIGGIELYDRDDFASKGINLKFLRAGDISYPQLGSESVPSLSIVDVLMFNGAERTQGLLSTFSLE